MSARFSDSIGAVECAGIHESYENLLAAVEKAHRTQERSHALFCSVASRTRALPRLPTGLPEPADKDPIRHAFFFEQEAARQYAEALNRLNCYIAAQEKASG